MQRVLEKISNSPLVFLTGLIFFIGCSHTEKPLPPTPVRSSTDYQIEKHYWEDQKVTKARIDFLNLEDRLLKAESIHVKCSVKSEGVVKADLTGTLSLSTGNIVKMSYLGFFAGQDVSLNLDSNGTTLRGDVNGEVFEMDTPAALNESLIIGLTRMGLLHNLALLSGKSPPDHCHGGILKWIEVSGFKAGVDQSISNNETKSIKFSVWVANEPSADAELWITSNEKIPVQRKQTVRFAGGDMKVIERYQEFDVN